MAQVVEILQQKPEIPPCKGIVPPSFRGEVELRGVVFAYPTRPSRIVLNGFDLKVKFGKTSLHRDRPSLCICALSLSLCFLVQHGSITSASTLKHASCHACGRGGRCSGGAIRRWQVQHSVSPQPYPCPPAGPDLPTCFARTMALPRNAIGTGHISSKHSMVSRDDCGPQSCSLLCTRLLCMSDYQPAATLPTSLQEAHAAVLPTARGPGGCRS